MNTKREKWIEKALQIIIMFAPILLWQLIFMWHLFFRLHYMLYIVCTYICYALLVFSILFGNSLWEIQLNDQYEWVGIHRKVTTRKQSIKQMIFGGALLLSFLFGGIIGFVVYGLLQSIWFLFDKAHLTCNERLYATIDHLWHQHSHKKLTKEHSAV